MTQKQARHADLTELLAEHAELHRSLTRIRRSFATEPDPRAIACLLSDLSAQLQSHFDHEEAGGYFVEAIELAPRLTARVERLLGQHLQFLETLELLQNRAQQAAGVEAGCCDELNRQFELFAKEFMEHEWDENALLHQVYSEDLGTSD